VYDIGDSWEKTQGIADRDILALKISDNVTVDEDEPEVLVMGLVHAREWITSEIALELVKWLMEGYGTAPWPTWLVDNREIWIIPVVNPDGLDYALNYDEMWRKNRHLNPDLTYGVDLNRNFNGSCNGDPLGAWGGAGSSTLPSSELYCGPEPFSEPETQALRDFVLQHNFSIALDFQSYGNLVLWPWGYTTNATADGADLSRIGSELAAEAGYAAEQSVMLYPTTGDSIDWMYGAAGVYPFTVEVGSEFHPHNTSVVVDSLNKNVHLALRGIEVAGDRENKTINITYEPLQYEQTFPQGDGFDIQVNLSAPRGVSSLSVYFRIENGGWTSLRLTVPGGNGTVNITLPKAQIGDEVDYYFVAVDNGGFSATAPTYSPPSYYAFRIFPPDPEVLGEVVCSIPSQVDGTHPWTVDVTVQNYTWHPDLVLYLDRSGVINNTAIPGVSDGQYQVVMPSMMALGEYYAQIRIYLGGYWLWTSDGHDIQVVDGMAPRIGSAKGYLAYADNGSREARVCVLFSDSYGVRLVTLHYRVNSGGVTSEWLNSTREMTGIVPGLTYNVSFTISVGNKEGSVEYWFEVSDSAMTNSSSSQTLTFARVPRDSPLSSPLALIAIPMLVAAAVIGLVAYLVIRARRR